MKIASVLRRVFASLVDSVIVFLVFVILLQLLVFVPLRSKVIDANWFLSGWNTEIYTLLTMSLPVWLYFSLFELSPWKATPGKRLLGLQTLSLAGAAGLTFGRSLLRTLIKLLPWEIAHLTNNIPVPMWYATNPGFRIGFALVPVLILVYLAVAQSSPKKQALHDLAAGTIVEYTR